MCAFIVVYPGNIAFYGNGSVLTGLLANSTADTAGAAVYPYQFAFITGIAQNPNLAFVGHNFNQVFGAYRNAFTAGGAFPGINHSHAVGYYYGVKWTNVFAACKPDAAVCTRFIPAGGKL
jgi:hypothetical protein